MTPEQLRAMLGSATVWHVNSTATGGGVAELLGSTIRAHEESGIRAKWHVIDGSPEFFEITKLLHHRLYGSAGGTRKLDDAAHATYSATTAREAALFVRHISAGDLVVLHDHQTLGMAEHLAAAGATVAWRLHLGTNTRNRHVADAWQFLRPYLPSVSRCVFSLASFVPEWLEAERVIVIPPAIDPSTAKNRPLTSREVSGILDSVGLTSGATEQFEDVKAVARVIQDSELPHASPVVAQVSRWDPFKDMIGVLRAFVDHVAPRTDAHLVLAGPDPADIPDDPEGTAVFAQVQAAWDAVPATLRARIHLVVLSLKANQANALAVNAIQQRAHVVVQHSLREGFGLTVTEAMWKSRAIVASNVDGIARQIDNEVHGLLTDDPTDLAALGAAINRLLTDPRLAARLGAAARQRCQEEFLLARETADYLALYADCLLSR